MQILPRKVKTPGRGQPPSSGTCTRTPRALVPAATPRSTLTPTHAETEAFGATGLPGDPPAGGPERRMWGRAAGALLPALGPRTRPLQPKVTSFATKDSRALQDSLLQQEAARTLIFFPSDSYLILLPPQKNVRELDYFFSKTLRMFQESGQQSKANNGKSCYLPNVDRVAGRCERPRRRFP